MEVQALTLRPKLANYEHEARSLIQKLKSADPGALRLARRHHPRLPGRANTNDRNPVTDEEIKKTGCTLADARSIIARSHQFVSWKVFKKHIEALNNGASPISQFEAAVEAIIDGKAAKLSRLLKKNPALIRARSTREHHGTLLHYSGANGVEGYRQRTPPNAVEVARILLDAGAEVDADLDYIEARHIYPERTGSTTLGLVATSCHPADAGVQIPLMDLLLDRGASIDGLPGGWNPLISALHNGRGAAARHLAKRGARLDLEGAAGSGMLRAVKGFFDREGRLTAGATNEQMRAGLMWACEYGHAAVVDFLLAKGVDIAAMPHGETGLHWAAFGGHAKVVASLLKAKPPLEVRDRRFNGTPLGWALYGWGNRPPESKNADYYRTVALLVRAGAKLETEWLGELLTKARGDKKMRRALRQD